MSYFLTLLLTLATCFAVQWFALRFYGTVVVLYHAWGWLREHREVISNKLMRSSLEPILHAVMLFFTISNPGAPRGFIYFQF